MEAKEKSSDTNVRNAGFKYLSKEISEKLEQIISRHGEKHNIQIVMGTRVSLENLGLSQSVCAGDGKHYHFLLTKKNKEEPKITLRQTHINRHLLLHQNLDELLADYITHTKKGLSDTKILDLMKWSYKQTQDPDEQE